MEKAKSEEIEGQNVFHVERSRIEGTGAGYVGANLHKESPLAKVSSDLPVHNRTVRAVASKFEGVGARVIDVLGICQTYFAIKGKIADNEVLIIDWSGARPNWKRRMREGIEEGLQAEVLERIEGRNHWLGITDKGERVLEFYNQRFEEIKQLDESNRIANLLKREAIRLRKETRYLKKVKNI